MLSHDRGRMQPVDRPQRGRTLVLLPIGLGNVIMATPAFRALSRQLGTERLAVLALKPYTAAMARSSGLASVTFAWDPDADGLGRGLALLRELRSARFSHSLALFPSANWKASVYQLAIGAADRLGFDYPGNSLPRLAQHRSIPLKDTHDVYQNLRIVEAFLGQPVADAGEPFFPLPTEVPSCLPAESFFACHPGSSSERGMGHKRLPASVLAPLLEGLFSSTRWRCVLVGGPEETGLREELAGKCREAIVPLDIGSLEQTARVLSRARFFFGNDSGLMHLAAAVGTRCAAFFGPTDERRTGPFGFWEEVGGAPRHLILRRPGTYPVWTLQTVGRNPSLGPQGNARWTLDVSWALSQLRTWLATFPPPPQG